MWSMEIWEPGSMKKSRNNNHFLRGSDIYTNFSIKKYKCLTTRHWYEIHQLSAVKSYYRGNFYLKGKYNTWFSQPNCIALIRST